MQSDQYEIVAVIAADTHLSTRIWSERPIEGDSYFALRQLTDLAVQHGADLVVAGDVLDRQRNRATPITRLFEQLDRLDRSGLTFYFVQGQHEMEPDPWCAAHRASTWVHRRRFTLGGRIRCYGLDCLSADGLAEELQQVPGDTDLLFAHQVWRDLMGNLGTPHGAFEQVPVVPRMVTGDYHVACEIDSVGQDGQDLRVYSPGSTHMRSIDEPAQPHCLLMDAAGGLHWQPLKSRPFTRYRLTTEEELETAAASHIPEDIATLEGHASNLELPEGIAKPIMRVEYSADLEDAARRIGRAVGSAAHLFLQERPGHLIERALDEDSSVGSSDEAIATLEGELEGYLEECDLGNLRGDCQRLLEAGEAVETELSRMRDEALRGPEGEAHGESESG